MPDKAQLYDMSGNVSEWCYDWYKEDFTSKDNTYKDGIIKNPLGAASSSYRVIRGGSCDDFAKDVVVSYRSNGSPSARSGYRGFRVVRSCK